MSDQELADQLDGLADGLHGQGAITTEEASIIDRASTELRNNGDEHFDGLLVPDERSPAEYHKIHKGTDVLVDPNTGKLVITGIRPNKVHNCDQRGCGSFEHKIAEFDVDKSLFEPYRNHTGDDSV